MRKDIPIKVVQVEFLRGWATAQSIALASYSYLAAPKGQESLAQGLPWVNFPLALALKGPSGTAKIGPEPLSRIECTF